MPRSFLVKAKGKKVTYAPAINMDAEARMVSAFTPVTPRKKGKNKYLFHCTEYFVFV